jgi:hypothetical protein
MTLILAPNSIGFEEWGKVCISERSFEHASGYWDSKLAIRARMSGRGKEEIVLFFVYLKLVC